MGGVPPADARFADANQFSLVDVPDDERVLIGAATTGLMGARHDPEVARRAFEESKPEIEELIDGYSTVIVIATTCGSLAAWFRNSMAGAKDS